MRRALKRVALVAGGVLLAALTAIAVVRVGPGRLAGALASVRPGWLGVALALMGVSLCLRAVSWIRVLQAALPGRPIPRLPVLRGTMIGVLASAVLPGRVGEAARTMLVARRLGNVRSTVSVVAGTVVSQSLLNVVALLALAGLVAASLGVIRLHGGALALAAVPLAIAALLVAAVRGLDSARRHAGARLRRRLEPVAVQIASVRSGLRVFARWRLALPATIAQFGAWALQVAACLAVLHAFGMRSQGWAAAAAVLVAVNVTAVVPVTPANVGVFQGACAAVLAAFGVGADRGLAYGVVLQGVELATALALGLPALAVEGLSWHDLRDAVRRGS